MSDNTFDPEEINLQVQPLPAFIDGDGAFKLNTPMLSSMNFDGMIPKYDGFISASQVQAGYLIDVDLNDQFYQVLSVEYDDLDLEVTNSVTINYINDQGYITSAVYNATSSVYVNYEDWNNKILGTQGWGITNAGNAIFSNVAVRGRIEATEGAIEGDLTLGGSLTASTNLGFVQISASGILGTTSSGRFHIDTTTGEIDLTGNITATSGQIKNLNIGPNYYPIININGVSTSSGHFIMRTSVYLDPVNFVNTRKLKNGEVFRLKGVISSSSCVYIDNYGGYSVVSASQTLNTEDFIVVSSSFTGSWPNNTYTYLCRYVWLLPGEIGIGFPPQYNFAGVTASSGSFNIGYLNFGIDYAHVDTDPLLGAYVTAQEGIIFENYRTGLVPDYIDLSGRFRLGGGKFNFDGSNLSVIGQINATSGSISGDLKLGGSLTASTNTGQLIISSSGIFGSTASGLFHLDSIDGEVSFTGDITANSGIVKKLTIGAGKSYPIINLVGTASVANASQSGNFILTLNSNSKNFYPGDYFYIDGVKTSGSAFVEGSPVTASGYFNNVTRDEDGVWSSNSVYRIITASYGPPTDSYFCRYASQGIFTNLDFSNVTGSSGSINFGYVYLGEYSTYALSNPTLVEGLVLSTVGPASLFQGYTPDYIDLSGRFSLGKGRVTFNGTSLKLNGFIDAVDGIFSGGIQSSSFSGITTQTGSSIGGIFQTPVFIGTTTGSAFSSKGILLNFNNGSFSCRDFRIDDLGFSTFAGTFTGTLSASSINSGGIRSTGYNGPPSTGSAFSTTGFHLNLNDGSIVSPAIRVTNSGFGFFKGGVEASSLRIDSPSTINTAYIQTEELFSGSTFDTISMSFYSGAGTFSHNGKSWTVDDIFSMDGTTRISDWLSMPNSTDISKYTVWNCGSVINNTSGIVATGPTIALIVSASAISASAAQRVNIDSQTTRISGSVFFPQVYNTLITSSRGVEIDSSGKLGYITSSFKAKENIVPLLENDYLNIPEEKLGENSDLEFYYMDVLKLTPVQFDWINGGKELGFISEQIQEIMPVASIDGDIPSYNPRVIMPALLAVVKKQQEYIEQLQSRVLQLESKLGG